MLLCEQFDNYEDFKSRFGYKTGLDGKYLVNANGVRQRKNNVVYLYWKEESLYLHNKKGYSLSEAYAQAHKFQDSKQVFQEMLYRVFGTDTSAICPIKSYDNYEILNYGICMDGDVSSIRYHQLNTNKIYKMKVGKYVNKYLDWFDAHNPNNNYKFWLNNPTLRIFFIEELTELWKNKRLKEQSMKVVIDKNFHKIYDPSKRPNDANSFNSCMDGDPNWHFYKDHSDIYDAVSLQDEDGLVYARAILVHCFDQNDNPHTYLERIYCNKRMYKDLMFEKAKMLGKFDLYKGLEASCHDAREIYTVENGRKINYKVYIPLDLKTGDYMSYQDTFKYYYKQVKRAYNTEMYESGPCTGLATTEVKIRVYD